MVRLAESPLVTSVWSDLDNDGCLVLSIIGRLDSQSTALVWREAIDAIKADDSPSATVDMSKVDYCDGSGVGLLVQLRKTQHEKGALLNVTGLAENFQEMLGFFDPEHFTPEAEPLRQPESIPYELGRMAVQVWRDIRDVVAFIGQLTLALPSAMFNWRQLRWGEVWLVAERSGVNALPIVALVGFLMGLIMSFQSAIPMQQFGAETFVADLIGISMIKELGPLLTAIILAGRTGSSFAAEIGTMKVNEEIDALTTMGLDPVKFLVVQRVLATTFMTPFLAVFASFSGLVGGGVVMLSLDIPLIVYAKRIMGAVDVFDFSAGMIKAVVFGILIAGVGCLRGLQTRMGATAVGLSTTSAVVSGIIIIAVTDGLFAVLFYYVETLLL